MMTEEKRARLTLIESCRLADYLRTDPSCIAYRKTCASYSDLATWVTGHWSGPRVPVGTLQTICEEYGLQLAKASVVADLVAREGIVTLCNVVNQILDLMRADGDDVEDLAVAVSSLQSYDGEADIS